MGDKGEGGVNNFKKWVTLFMDGPKAEIRSFWHSNCEFEIEYEWFHK